MLAICPQPSLHCTTSGNIEVFKDMPIEKLNLYDCSKLTGESVQISLLTKFQCWIMLEGCCPRATPKRTFPGMFFISPHPFPPTSGDIKVFKGMPIEKLNLYCCVELTGEWVGISLLEISEIMLAGCCPRATLKSGHRN